MTLPLQASLRDRMFRGLLVCLFVSGGSGLIYEIAWVRSLELVFGATSFAVATVLAAFMGGLALGSWLMGMAADRLERFHPLRIYAVIECLIGVAGLLVPMALHALVPLYQSIWIHFHSSFAVFGLWRLVLCGAVLLVPTALMGATLPVASRLAAGDPGSDGGAVQAGTIPGGPPVWNCTACVFSVSCTVEESFARTARVLTSSR